MPITNPTDFFLNFQRFDDLKLLARKRSDDATLAVAQQFEGLFVQQMLSAMRAAAQIDAGQHSSYLDFYQEMYDKQLAQSIAGQDRLGVSKMILQQLPTQSVETGEPVETEFQDTRRAADNTNSVEAKGSVEPPGVEADDSPVRLSKVVDDDFAELKRIEQASAQWRNPADFVADIWPQAKSVAQDLGVNPRVLIAQAALETGWGKHTMKLDDGRSSYNLFGIKAGSQWQGGSLRKASLEFQDGQLSREISSFRAYASTAQSMTDYVEFIRTSPRYQQALARADDDRAYITELHKAGYATDPEYAAKVIGILDGEVLHSALAKLERVGGDHA